MYKVSRFCYICEYKDTMILFNSFNGKLMYCTGTERENINWILKNISNCADVSKNNAIKGLLNYGFLIPDSLDEQMLERKRYWDEVYDSSLGLIIMPTEQCNFRCKYCYEKFEISAMSQKIINNLIIFLKRNIRKYTSLNISWFGGEPLLALDIVQSVSDAVLLT